MNQPYYQDKNAIAAASEALLPERGNMTYIAALQQRDKRKAS